MFSTAVNLTETTANNCDKKTPPVQTFLWQVLSAAAPSVSPRCCFRLTPFCINKLQLPAPENLKMHNRHHLLIVLARAMSSILLSNRDLQVNSSICFTLKFLVWQVRC